MSAFYVDVLGMTQTGPSAFRYSEAEVELNFSLSDHPYQPSRTDVYWKIAISVPDLDLACQQLAAKGIVVDGPRQFRDIGYLAHISDPAGYVIELIQHVFDGESKPPLAKPNALGGGPCLNLVTLRATSIEDVQFLCRDQLNMKLLCIEPVEPYGFTLYFFADTDDVPPAPDPMALANRGWTYQRPYTVLEIQHLHETGTIIRHQVGSGGYLGLSVSGLGKTDKTLGLVPG